MINTRDDAAWDDLAELIAHGPPPAAKPSTAAEAFEQAMRPPPPRPWRRMARPAQLTVADSTSLYTLLLAGRGFGKTFTAANTMADRAVARQGTYAVVAPTFGDCRSICVEGPSGLIRALGDDLDRYDKSKYELHLKNGSVIIMASDEAPKRLRGPNLSGIWGDEIASWRNVKETFDEGIEFATRIGDAWRLFTGTPKRGHSLVKLLYDKAIAGDPDVSMVRGTTMDNAANLAPTFLRAIMAKYKGTTLGRAELEGEMLSDAEGALMTSALIESTRCQFADVPPLRRVVVGCDPALTDRPESDHTGIVVVGIGPPPLSTYLGETARVTGDHLYVLADESMQGSPESWGERVLKVAEQWAADNITAEVNAGGDLVGTMIRMVSASRGLPMPRLQEVRAAVSKRTRAEPVAGVFEQRRIHIVDALPDVEDQLAGWAPGDEKSPDQLDATVWAAVALMPSLAIGKATEVKLIA